jgi:hypothetical protein
VLAAAPGLVLRVRNGMADAPVTEASTAELDGKECGNGLVIDHGDGWETQYCHMRQGSILVEAGLRVRMGQVLGQVGLSGQTGFPHVHLSIRKDGRVVDPFDNANQQSCGGTPEPLWLDPVAYQPGGFISVGIAPAVPVFDALKAGVPSAPVGRDTPLVVWGFLFGGQAGDMIEMVLTGPHGDVMHRGEAVLDRTQAQLFRASGTRAPAGGWPAGPYRALISLMRNGAEIDSRSFDFTLAR